MKMSNKFSKKRQKDNNIEKIIKSKVKKSKDENAEHKNVEK